MSKHDRKQPHHSNSDQQQHIGVSRAINFKLQNSVTDTKEISPKKIPACLNGTQDEELQSNNDGIEYSNSCYIQDEGSDEYFGVSYDDKMKMPCTKTTNLDP